MEGNQAGERHSLGCCSARRHGHGEACEASSDIDDRQDVRIPWGILPTQKSKVVKSFHMHLA